MKRWFKKYLFHILSFFVPCFILFFIFLFRCFFRDQTILTSDAYAQYLSFFSYLKRVITSGESLFYQLGSGLGSEMFGTYAYYLASPLNILLIFFPKEHLDIFFMVIVVLKISLSSFTMFLYMRSKKTLGNIWKLIFSFCYAFMAYHVGYYFHVMWLDGMIFAPLIIFGIEKLISSNHSKLYAISLLLAIFSNYYIGFSLCIFSCIYFIYYIVIKNYSKRIIIQRSFKFLVVSVLVGLSLTFLIFPTLIQITSIEREVTFSSDYLTSILDFFQKGYIGSQNYDNVLNTNGVNWYCGIIIILLVLRYFLNHQISKKEKIASFIVLCIFLLSFKVTILNVIWHGFSNPICFNYRYSFLFSFFLILISERAIEKIEPLSTAKFLIFLFSYIIISLIAILYDRTWTHYLFVLISVFLLIIYECVIECILQEKNKEKLLIILLCLLVTVELSFNMFLTFRDYRFAYVIDQKDLWNRDHIILKNSDEFSRMEFTSLNTSNDSLVSNYYGITVFNSMLNHNVSSFLSRFGFTFQSNSIYYNTSGTLISDSILGVTNKYGMEEDRENYIKKREYSCSSFSGLFYDLGKKKCGIYENKNALSLGYMVHENATKKIDDQSYDDVFEYQNLMLNSMTNQRIKYFKPYKIIPIYVDQMQYQLDDSDIIYLYMDSSFGMEENHIIPAINIYINDQLLVTLDKNNHGIQKIKNNFKNQLVTVRFEVVGGVKIYSMPVLYSLDSKLAKQSLLDLSSHSLTIQSISNTKIQATIDATSDKPILFLSIPYSDGWSIYVDGKKEKKLKLYNAFLGVKLKSGKHQIELKYETPGFLIGLVISVCSFIILTVYLILEEKKIHTRKRLVKR